MKYAFGWLVSQALFLIGHVVSRVLVQHVGGAYPLYNWLMTKSCAVSDWSGAGVWIDCRDKQGKVTT